MATETTLRPTSNPIQSSNVSNGWLLAMGIALILLGAFALVTAFVTTLMSVFFIGALFILAAIFQFVFSATSKQWSGFALHLLLAILYAVAGVFLVLNPVMGAATLTLFLAFFFITSGFFRIVASVVIRYGSWGWSLFSGLVAVALGVYVLMNLGIMSLFLIGTIFGIDILFLGINLTAFGWAVRKENAQLSSGPMRPAHA